MQIAEVLEREPSGGAFWARFYDMHGARFGEDPFPFLNLGYLGPGDPTPESDDERLWERLSERLYDKVIAGIDPADGTVVEVGCGRGGGCARLAGMRRRATIIGLDRSRTLIGWCTDAYADFENLSFRLGDALELPFASGSVDLVVNVESSHCYPSRSGFFREVARVLAPGGHFAYADIVLPSRADRAAAAIERKLEDAGLTVLEAEDVVGGVLEARRAVSRSDAFHERLTRIAPEGQGAETFRELCFVEGSDCFARLDDGSFGYWRWLAAKS